MPLSDPTAELTVALTIFIQAMADEPEAVRLEATTLGLDTTFRVQTSARDFGKLIGSNGRTARALRIILIAAGRKYGRSFALDLPNSSPAG